MCFIFLENIFNNLLLMWVFTKLKKKREKSSSIQKLSRDRKRGSKLTFVRW